MVESNMPVSKAIKEYFDYLEQHTDIAYKIAQKARSKGYDFAKVVEIQLAKNMAERVVGIISVVAPQIVNSGVTERIIELEKVYGSLDWRVAFSIAHEIAEEKFCKFENKKEAIEVGVRTGFAYVTVGVVSSPLEGLTSIDIRKRLDGQGEYFCVNFAGPIRNAGGTMAAVSVLIADYVRKKMGYAKYDPDEKEINRCHAEIEDYQNFIARRQYRPTKPETDFLMKNIPVEISGDPSEKREISNSNLKDLPRITTNLLRSGYALIHTDCIPLKAPKLWKQLNKWGHDFDMEDWDFLGEYVKMQKEIKSRQKTPDKKEDTRKVKPDMLFVKDLVGGRPVIGHPMRSGALRLRYGRGRASGYSGQSINPATMTVLSDFIATGTQLKVERPGKAAAFTPCDRIMGPIVKLKDDSVVYVKDEELGRKIAPKIKEVIYLGDVLINYGDFFDRAHILIPPGYCEEFWSLETKEKLEQKEMNNSADASTLLSIPEESIKKILDDPLVTSVSFASAKTFSDKLKIPLHPQHTFFYREITPEQLKDLVHWMAHGKYLLETPKVVLPYKEEYTPGKRALELLGMPHTVINNEYVIIESDEALALTTTLNVRSQLDAQDVVKLIEEEKEKSTLEIVNLLAPYEVRDKSGIFIGARMGRPEKAKMRKLTGSPNGLFPVGEDGGRLRSFQSALEVGKVTSTFPVFVCPKCQNKTPFSICDMCETPTVKYFVEAKTGLEVAPDKIKEDTQYYTYKEWSVPIRSLFDYCLKKMKTKIYPDLIKGVRGTVGKDHVPEHLIKAIIRARNGVAVNKDGTVRYDASEVTLTHFKPKEIGTSVKRLRELGYTLDVYGNELVEDNQVLELRAQDMVLPACSESLDAGSDIVLLNTAKFIDELLVFLYGEKPFYKAKTREDLVGHLVVGLAPHTSAGTVGRIIGFSKTQAMLCHPLYHAAMRRDCDGDEGCFFLLMDAFLNFSKGYIGTSRGSTMDMPLVLTTLLNPAEVDDMAFNVDIVDHYPLEFYRAACEYKYPWDVKIKQISDVLFTEKQFEGMMFTHDTDDINAGVLCSAYKLLPSMTEKIEGQMEVAKKVRAVDSSDVARLIIETHFIRDTKGNLRKFSLQQFRCVKCNEKFRRPPLEGKCNKCGGKIVFTISEGSVIKYLEMSIRLAEEHSVSDYLKESLQLTKKRIIDVFGKEKEKQVGLGSFM